MKAARRSVFLILNSTAPPSTGTDAFSGLSECYLVLPDNASGYEAAPWNDTNLFHPYFDFDYREEDDHIAIVYWGRMPEKEDLVIPETILGKPVTIIETAVFSGISELTSVKLPSTIQTIGDSVFHNCINLKQFTINTTTAPTLGSSVFSNVTDCVLNFPEGATGFDIEPWTNPVYFTASQAVQDGLTYELHAGTAIITDCDESLAGNIVIPYSVNSRTVVEIDDYAFQNCNLLTSVEIPSAIVKIGQQAFDGCTSLEELILNTATAPSVNLTSFQGVSDCILTVPEGAAGFDAEPWTYPLFYPVGAFSLDDVIYFNHGSYVEIIDCREDKSGNVLIPETADGISVIVVAENSFRFCSQITSISRLQV